jgi:hypothetical protein
MHWLSSPENGREPPPATALPPLLSPSISGTSTEIKLTIRTPSLPRPHSDQEQGRTTPEKHPTPSQPPHHRRDLSFFKSVIFSSLFHEIDLGQL